MELKVAIEGITDYVQNQFTIKEEEAAGVKKAKKTGEGGSSIEDKLYFDKDGCYIPPTHIEGALKEAAKSLIKKGKSNYSKDFEAGIFVVEDRIRFTPNKKEPDGILLVAGRIPPKTGSRVPIKRPSFHKGWQANFTLEVDEEIPIEVVKEAIVIAGAKKGIGDWRPRYGRFKVLM